MKFQYPKDKQYLCFNYTDNSLCNDKYSIFDSDGICRKTRGLRPTQIVCPIGTTLCPDLTWRDSLSQCYTDYPECSNNQVRCPDQSCVNNITECPTTITCSDPKYKKICPDRTCVSDESYCQRLKTCPENEPFLCADYTCAKNAESCSHFPACGHEKSLCSRTLTCSEFCPKDDTTVHEVIYEDE